MLDLNGCQIAKGYLNRAAQEKIVADVRSVAKAAPFQQPMTPWGKPMSVRMTAAGKYGWYTDRRGYRYIDRHPNGTAWPPIPKSISQIWAELVDPKCAPDCCLINFYGEKARMGLHQDKDETRFEWPVLSISLGDTALFRVGGTTRNDPTKSIDLESGDIALLIGPSRLAFHGIDRTKFGSSSLLPDGGRLNLTLRVVD